MHGLRRAEIRSDIRFAGADLTTPQPRTGKSGSTGRGSTGRGSSGKTGTGAAGTGAGTAVKPPDFLRHTLNRQTATGRIWRLQRVGGGPAKPPRRIAAMLAHHQGGSAEARALKRLRQPLKVRMQVGGLARGVRVIATSMSREQLADYYAAQEGKISWAQYRARWGQGPQPG